MASIEELIAKLRNLDETDDESDDDGLEGDPWDPLKSIVTEAYDQKREELIEKF